MLKVGLTLQPKSRSQHVDTIEVITPNFSLFFIKSNPNNNQVKMKSTCLFLVSLAASASAFAPSAPQTRASTSLSAQITRSQVLNDVATAFGVVAASTVFNPLAASADEVTPSGVSIKVIKSGNGPAPEIGELAAIRFASYFGEQKIDNIFDTPEPYYTRIGSGGLIKGVEEVLPKMKLGDRWVLTIPVSCVETMSFNGVVNYFVCLTLSCAQNIVLYRATLHLDPKENPLLLELHVFLEMLKLHLMWRWLAFLGKSLSLLTSLETKGFVYMQNCTGSFSFSVEKHSKQLGDE